MVSGGLLKVAFSKIRIESSKCLPGGGSLKGFRDGFFFECAMC